MSSLDFLYYTLGVGFIGLVIALVYLIFHLVETIKVARFMMEDAEDFTSDLVRIKDHFKVGILGLFNGGKIINSFKRR
jgi:hypothetical protein